MERSNRFSVTGYRLVALWAFAEAGLGGVLHALHLPVTGLLVGGFAVLCMALLAAYERPGVILPALGVVLAVKFLASPHSPPPAYLAVTFQGLIAWLLFSFVPNFRIAALLLGMLSLLESASQKLLMLLLYFGKPLYEASGAFIASVASQFNFDIDEDGTGLVISLVSAYLVVHLAMGLYIGYKAGKLPKKLRTYDILESSKLTFTPKPEKNPLSKWVSKLLVLMVPAIIIFFYYQGGSNYVFINVLLRLVLVYLLTGPVLQVIIGLFLHKKANRYSLEVSGILKSLPYMRSLLISSWKASKIRGKGRLTDFMLLFIASWLFRPSYTIPSKERSGNS
ncbi:hypothetical protein AB9P05_23560 [Roseivirga sp. BDSF3-8]|uniref:hypothetical protein n=1 Tax=Roseivirga sp. BDSF3-8 TaxID=3241598 RepID=UPI0035319E3E